MERINYFDFLKGIAIILVVMGHITEKSMEITTSLFNHLYSSFHMPLFIVISGFLCFKHSQFTLFDLINFIYKKILRIILPFLSIGFIYGLWNFHNPIDGLINKFQGLWFLPTIFYCMVISYIALYISKIICNNINIHLNICLLGLIWITSYTIYIVYHPIVPYYLHYIKMFPYFAFGIILAQNNQWYNSILNNKILFTISIIFYTIILTLNESLSALGNFNIAGFFAIIILFQLCKQDSNNFLYKKITQIGRFSIEIYLFHWFLLPSLPTIGKWLTQNISTDGMPINNGNLIIIIIICLTVSIPIIISCIYITYIIKKSSLLSFFILGIPMKK